MKLRAVVVLAAAAAFAGHALAAQTAPALTLSVARATPGESVQVAGSGFPASAALTVSIDGRQIGTATADAGGVFGVTLAVPSDILAGAHSLAAADPGGASARVALTVGPADPARIVEGALDSKGLGGALRFAVYLPPGYSTGSERYPVIYFLHGLPAGDFAYRSWTSFLMKNMQQVGLPAIAVIPQASRANDPDPEYLDWGETRNWETALASELPAYVDANFRTIPGRLGRGLVGVSAGGYGAVILGLHRLAAFSVIESWSGYFEPTDPTGAQRLDLGSRRANDAANAFTFVSRLGGLFELEPTFLAFYVGDQDARFRLDNVRFHRRLVAASVRHAFAHYPGGHATSLWSSHATQWLGLALQHLDPAG